MLTITDVGVRSTRHDHTGSRVRIERLVEGKQVDEPVLLGVCDIDNVVRSNTTVYDIRRGGQGGGECPGEDKDEESVFHGRC